MFLCIDKIFLMLCNCFIAQQMGKGKSKGKGKGKGKGRPKKRKSREISEDICPSCEEEWYAKDPEPWIGCSSCDRWWHKSCAKITDEQWALVSVEDTTWNCPKCM